MVSERIKKPGKILSSKAKRFQNDIRKHMATAIAAGFAFVMALVWRDAIQAGIDRLFEKLGVEGTGYIYKIIIAVLVTVMCVVGLRFVALWSEQEKNPEKKPEKK